MSEDHYLACDLGAESGRLMAGHLCDGRLRLEEIHRFPNQPVQEVESLRWDLEALQTAIEVGLHKAAQTGVDYQSISCDSWGVDYVLYDAQGQRMQPAFHYRDPRTARGVKTILNRMPWESIFAESGIQFMPLNALFQLGAEAPERLASARTLLGVGDAFNHWLGGKPALEVSMASTFQLYHPMKRAWSEALVAAAGLRAEQLPELVPSGTITGTLSQGLMERTGLGAMKVVATCSHDTGAAVAAVPVSVDDSGSWAYLSSGTWSLMGVECAAPILSDGCRELNYTNEVGHGHSIRLLKNLSGMWLLQECRRAWEAEGEAYDYQALTEMAQKAEPWVSLIQPSHPRFLAPGGMPERIAAYCRETGQPVPASKGAMVRCLLESLALLYRQSLQDLETLTDQTIQTLHIVGGGSQNQLLNQWTADALQRTVVAGPVEATAVGNLMIQAIALGQVKDLHQARAMVARSFPTTTYLPLNAPSGHAARERFASLPADA